MHDKVIIIHFHDNPPLCNLISACCSNSLTLDLMLTPPVGKSSITEALCSWAVNANCYHKALGQCLRPLHSPQLSKIWLYKFQFHFLTWECFMFLTNVLPCLGICPDKFMHRKSAIKEEHTPDTYLIIGWVSLL